ncbi:hypothetical protein ASG63_12575 [Methylobacterium sp. Leaf94]|uniref:hypothetical protein n=1 Tax=Methylobacterium sp. Leaf94 TaxID=1736250 RepID=UPI0006F73908|nr:hypothetical protein [Methylobacterium sp. Leaf94]KQU34282.1 hypothetical protein ASG63_12575 [Methylobacterium sp. Leaf94]
MNIEIPGEITFSRTYNIPPISVSLPLTAGARTFAQVAITAIAWCFMMPTLALFVMLLWHALTVAADPGGSVLVLCALAFLLLAFMPIALFGLEDFTRAGPTLILDAEGITDRRGGLTIPWTDIAAVRIVASRNETGIRLTLRTPIQPRPLFDRGSERFLGRRSSDQYRVGLSRLTVRPHVLGQTALALVRAHGGTVER